LVRLMYLVSCNPLVGHICGMLTPLSPRRRRSRVYITTSTLAQWCFLCRCILSHPFPPDMVDGSYRHTQGPPSHRIRLPIHIPPLHLLLPCQLLLDLLFHRRLAGRPKNRPIRPQRWAIYLRDPPLRMCSPYLPTIYPQHGQPAPGSTQDVPR
jgi:hypothetical protein